MLNGRGSGSGHENVPFSQQNARSPMPAGFCLQQFPLAASSRIARDLWRPTSSNLAHGVRVVSVTGSRRGRSAGIFGMVEQAAATGKQLEESGIAHFLEHMGVQGVVKQ